MNKDKDFIKLLSISLGFPSRGLWTLLQQHCNQNAQRDKEGRLVLIYILGDQPRIARSAMLGQSIMEEEAVHLMKDRNQRARSRAGDQV